MLFVETLPMQMDALKAGISHGQVGQRPFEMGYKAMYVLNDLTQGKSVEDPVTIGLDVCTPETVATCKKCVRRGLRQCMRIDRSIGSHQRVFDEDDRMLSTENARCSAGPSRGRRSSSPSSRAMRRRSTRGPGICRWAAELGYIGIQLPSGDKRFFDLDRAAESQTYCDEITGVAREHGIAITELSTHLQGQLVAVHPAFDLAFDAFAPPELHGQAGRAAALGRGAAPPGRQGFAPARSRHLRVLHGRAGLALRLSLAAAALRAGRGGVRGAGPALEADSRCLRRARASTSASRSIPARTCSTAPPSSSSSRRSAGIRAAPSTTTRRTSCCSSSTT